MRTGLLPAFEPSSSPRLPRPNKRKHDGSPVPPCSDLKRYPTPVPTSSTGVIASSSPHQPNRLTHPPLQRTASTVSERVPLGDVRGLELNINGAPLLLGRSSNSSQYQLSANRLISRVHVKVAYHRPDEQHHKGRVIIECLGWNGMRIYSQGCTHDMSKGDTFVSTKPLAEIMVGVQDARVLIRWPSLVRKDSACTPLDATWEVDGSPAGPTPPATPFPSSPPLIRSHLRSPVSPSSRSSHNPTASNTFLGLPSCPPSSPPAVQVYEDRRSSDRSVQISNVEVGEQREPQSSSKVSQTSSSLSEPEEFSDHDEENDPIIHSFGPFGENLLPRMASFRAVSPERRREPLRASVSPRQPQSWRYEFGGRLGLPQDIAFSNFDIKPITNHIVNQLAFSRLHSLPLGILLENLPISLRGSESNATQYFSDEGLRSLLDDEPCVGMITREGKDAAGKALENEYYYVPEMDADEGRRAAVEGGKPGMRAVRKQHKVGLAKTIEETETDSRGSNTFGSGRATNS
ncbi:MAG: hypothetical protein Q9162_002518 [Coniocarpon cinnabarinum]